jgi:hypothetical protein
MRVTRAFAPVTIVLETEKELEELREALYKAIRKRDSFFGYRPEKYDTPDMLQNLYQRLNR